MQTKYSPKALVAIAVVLMLLGGVFAFLFNTSLGSVEVTRVEFDTERGRLAGLLYLPRGASAEDPRPALVTTTGYLNAREMQAAPAIELSRRGVVVLALDHYSHGNSFLNEIPPGGEFFSFWTHTIYDGVQYIYDMPYVLKDEDGNGIIAVSGHSMGGFSSTMAVVFDEQDYQTALAEGSPAVRKVIAGLSVGADFFFPAFLGITPDVANGLYGDRTMGMIAAQFDEFFFDSTAVGASVIKKDFISTPEGQTFLGNPATSEVGEFVDTAQGGKRIIYQPFETHPWTHFSLGSTRDMVEFYETAFRDHSSSLTPRFGQIWWIKEVTSVLGLVGFYLLLIPIVALLGKAPILKHAITESVPEISGPTDTRSKIIFWLSLAAAGLIPAFLYTTYMDRAADGLAVIRVIGLLIFFASIVMSIVKFFRKKSSEALPYMVAGIGAFILAGLSAASANILQLNPTFSSPVTNNVALWAASVGAITVILVSLVFAVSGQKSGLSPKSYGFIIPAKSIAAGFAVALIAAASAFAMVQAIHWMFNVDFRLWLVAVRAFNVPHLVISLVYMPFIFGYFLMNGIALQGATNSSYLGGKRGYLFALATNIGGLVLWLLLQYGILLLTGRAAMPTQSLNSIVLIGLTVNLGIATIITKKAFEATNNVYVGAFLNTLVITVITISTSTLYWSIG